MSDASENTFHPPTDGRSEIDVLRLIISAATLCDNYRIVGGFWLVVVYRVNSALTLHCIMSHYLPYRVSGSTLTAVGRSQLLSRWPGTHSRILSAIQRAAQTVLGVYLKRTCSRVTSASSALGIHDDYALYKSTHVLTHAQQRTVHCGR